MESTDGFCIVNDEVVPYSQRLTFSSNQTVVYEVVRLIEGKPLFFREHLLRLENSCRIANVVFHWNSIQIKQAVRKLVITNNALNVNFKMEVFLHTGRLCYQMYLIPSFYPLDDQYRAGVSVGLFHAERANPNAKTVNAEVRSRADELMKSNSWFEVLLVNHAGEITEGSRSNFFLVGQSTLLTPSQQSVLPGITRQMVLRLASELRIEVEEASIPFAVLQTYPAAFLSGTSPGLIPIATIGDINYSSVHPIYLKLRDAYRNLVFDDLSSFTYGENS